MKAVWMLCVVLVQPSLALAEQGAFGAPLGPKPVGYRVVWATDITRSWQVPDAAGRLQPGPRAVRVSLWYPAKPGSGRAMTFRNYMEPPVARHVPKSLAEAIHANDIGSPTYSFRGIYRDDVAAFERAMKSSVAARDSASPAPGRYPVVIYSVGQNDFSQDAVCMAEWLASNGCIVASVPHLGTSPRRTLLFVHDPLSYETQLRDLEVALKEALKLTTADPNRILAMGHSYGGIYALLLAMRGNSIRGVIGLDPTYVAQRASYEYDLRKFPYFDADVRVPIATLRRGSGSINRDLLNSLTHAERLEIEYPDLMHGDFTTVAYIRRDLPPALQLEEETKVRSPQVAAAGASSVFHQVEALIEAIFSGNRLEAAVKKDGTKQVTTYTSALSTPTTEELYWIYRSKGLEGARTAIQESRAQAPETMVFSEPRMLTIARELGYSGKNNESLDMFRLAAVAFPDSSSAQLAAAEALIDAGLKAEARVLIESALKRDPKNQSAVDLLAKTKE